MKIAKNSAVTIDYTLTDPKGQVLDSSKGRQPLSYLHGAGNIIPGLEAALEGKAAGETLVVTIPPDKAYGEKNPAAIQPVPRTMFSGIQDIQVGMQFQARGPNGTQVVTVVGVSPDTVTVDANHPLAGVELKFDVAIVAVRAATEEELSHGHIHDGSHQH